MTKTSSSTTTSATWRDRTILVTGASSGIGRACAIEAAHRGADVVLVARRADRLEELAASLRTDHDVRAECFPADLTTADDVDRLIAEYATDERLPDLIVNNAGLGSNQAFTRDAPTKLDTMIRLNVTAAMRLMHGFGAVMKRRGRGSILNVSSIAGMVPTPWHGTYSATKAALLHFSEGLHAELRPHGVTVTAVCPGVTDTEFFDAGDYDTRTPIYRMARMNPAAVARIGFDAVDRKRMTVVCGLRNKLLIAMCKWLPYTFVAWSAGRTMKVGDR